MKIKLKTISTITIISLLVLMCSACSWFFEAADTPADNFAFVSFKVTNFESSSARSLILPETITAESVDKFVLNGEISSLPVEGEESKGKIENLEFASYDDLTSYSGELYNGSWTFSLAAYKDDKKIAEQTGLSVTLDASKTVQFTLSELASGNGSYELTVLFPLNGAAKVKYKISSLENLSDSTGLSDIDFTTRESGGVNYSSVTVSSDVLAKGYYFLRLFFYSDSAATKLISRNTFYFQISPNYKTSATLTLSDINTPYSIVYKNDDGTDFTYWNPAYWSGTTPASEYNSSMQVVLPVKKDVKRSGYKFLGWYTAADSGTLTTGWAVGTTGTQTVYAKWESVYDIDSGAVSFTNDDITFDISTSTVTKGLQSSISVTVTQNKGTANAKVLTTSDFTNFAIKMYSSGMDISSQTEYFTIDNANEKITVKNLPAEQKLTLQVSLTYNGKNYGGSFEITVSSAITATIDDFASLIADLPAGEYTISLTADLSNASNITTVNNALKSNTSAIINLNLSNNTFTTLAGSSSASLYSSNLKSVVLPDTVTKINDYTFYNCTGLQSITLPSTMTTIGKYVFYGCSNLTDITIPTSVTTIGDSAFYGCTKLSNITIPSNVTSIGSRAFDDCTALTSITIPSNVTTIGSYAFYGCKALTEITIPSSLTNINYHAFDNCTALTSVSIPSSVKTIKEGAFYNTGLTSVSIPASVTYIHYSAFQSCSNLTNISVDSGNTIYDSRNNCNAIIQTGTNSLITGCKATVIPDTVTSIGQYAFFKISDLTDITIPSSVTTIGNYAFRACTGLTSIVIPSSVTDLGLITFSDCTGLTNVTLPSTLTTIGQSDFYNCTSLTSITIPSSVTCIGESAFNGCTGLTSITIPYSVTTIVRYAFQGCTSLTSMIFEDLIHSWEKGGSNTNTFTPTSDAASNANYIVTNSSYSFGKSETVTTTLDNLSTTLASLPAGECTIAMSADMSSSSNVQSLATALKANPSAIVNLDLSGSSFTTFVGGTLLSGVTNLKSIKLPSTLTSIASTAFRECTGLTTITIPSGVTSIEATTFLGCTALTSITLPSSLTYIGSSAFNGCTGLTTITIPSSVTTIDNGAFCGCTGLTSMTIPAAVTRINNMAFYNCSGLTSVTFEDLTHSWHTVDSSGTATSPEQTFTPTSDTSANATALKATYAFKNLGKVE